MEDGVRREGRATLPPQGRQLDEGGFEATEDCFHLSERSRQRGPKWSS